MPPSAPEERRPLEGRQRTVRSLLTVTTLLLSPMTLLAPQPSLLGGTRQPGAAGNA